MFSATVNHPSPIAVAVPVFDEKEAARQWVWDELQERGLARFPFPPHGRIPNVDGARQAAQRLLEHSLLAKAGRVKANPDAPQRLVRAGLLERGVEVYVPTPRLKGGFKRLDPSTIPPEDRLSAASLSKMDRWAEPVALDELPAMDVIVAGSVAVTTGGRRAGKGEGYSDLEYAILRELGHPAAPVVTTVHELQVVEGLPRDATDVPLSLIATPERVVAVDEPPPAPAGIVWERLSEERIQEMPVLGELRARQRGA